MAGFSEMEDFSLTKVCGKQEVVRKLSLTQTTTTKGDSVAFAMGSWLLSDKRGLIVFEILLEYRYLIWLLGGPIAYWLATNIPAWQRVARAGTWSAERDFAAWRVRNALMALVLLVPLLALTTMMAFQ